MKYKAFHKLSYGLYLIASEFEGQKAGFIANTAFQVTSEPPQIAVSCNKKNDTLAVILQSGVFSLSVLKKEANTSLIGEFGFMASSEFDKFKKTETIKKTTGAPVVIDSCVAWFDCRVVNTVDVGSHLLIIGEVLDSDLLSDDDPLTYQYYREKYKMLSPRNSPTFIDRQKLDAEEQAAALHAEKKPEPETETPGKTGDDPYICNICGYVYHPEEGDPAVGIPAGTPFSDLPEDYRCPICNAAKEYFRKA